MRGAAGATSSLWVRPPSACDSACAERPPLSLILSPGGGEESGKGGPCPTSVILPRSARRRAALLVLEAASQATVDRGCQSERSLRSEESTRSDLLAASAQAGGFATALEDKSLRVGPSLRSG